ncbi:hypothetical protein ACS0TY_012959 [Phlomoides rotata]
MLNEFNVGQDEDESVDESMENMALCVVGRCLTKVSYNFNIMRSRMASIWKPRRGVLFKDIGDGRFIIQFYYILNLNRVMDGGPWSFDNFPLILHRLELGENPKMVPLNKLPF